MNKGMGTALGFLLVLLVVALGFYVAYSSFQSSRAALLFEPTQVPRTSTPTPRPTTAPTSTATPVAAPVLTATLALTASVEPSATPAGPQAPATGTKPAATQVPVPTVPPTSSYEFRPGPPVPETAGDCCYIRGSVRDAAGNGLPDVVLQVSDDWGHVYSATTKADPEAGQYNFVLGRDKLTYYVKVVNAQGVAISTQAIVQFDPAVAPSYRVDWKRSF